MLKPTDVIWLDPEWLKASGRCFTNSLCPQHDVTGEHYFLITGRTPNQECTAAPMFSDENRNSPIWQRLVNAWKTGQGASWRHNFSYLYRFQTWRIPDAVIANWVQAGHDGAVRAYAPARLQIVAGIDRWMAKNRNDWHRAIIA